MDKIIIAAIADNGCIGVDGKLPWHFSADMHWFKQQTTDHAVVMGRKTFDSISKSGMGLPNRCNIVLSRSINLTLIKSERAPTYVYTLDDAFQIAEDRGHEKCFVIGGAEIYRLALPVVDKLMITHVKGSYDGDAFFPSWPVSNRDWELGVRSTKKELSFCTYDRAKKPEENQKIQHNIDKLGKNSV